MNSTALTVALFFAGVVQTGLFAGVGMLIRAIHELTKTVTEMRIESASVHVTIFGRDGAPGHDTRLRLAETRLSDHETRLALHDTEREDRRHETRRSGDDRRHDEA